MSASHLHLSGARDPARLLAHTLDGWGKQGDVWIFGYASLIWRPEFDAVEERPAMVHGWHRALAMRSRVNRGTPECPGLVFALVPGRLVPWPRLSHRAGSGRGRAAAPVAPRDADRRLRPQVARLPDAAGRRPRPRLHAQPAQPEPHRRAARHRAGRDPAHGQRPLRQHARLPGRDRSGRCAPAASATATSSAWSRWRAGTRSPPEASAGPGETSRARARRAGSASSPTSPPRTASRSLAVSMSIRTPGSSRSTANAG